MKIKCPCKGCTPETGRAPGCHNDSCPHGWTEYVKAYRETKERQRRAENAETAINDIAIRWLRRGKKGCVK